MFTQTAHATHPIHNQLHCNESTQFDMFTTKPAAMSVHIGQLCFGISVVISLCDETQRSKDKKI